MQMQNPYYVYAHVKPNNEIFYIGKGTRSRKTSLTDRNKHWQNVANKYGWSAIVLADNLTEEQALKEEILLIDHFGKFGSLTNKTKGGDGVSGYKHTEETKAKLAEHNKQRSAEWKAKLATYRKDVLHTAETKQKMSESRKGEKNSFFGKKHTPETLEKIKANRHKSIEARGIKVKFNGILYQSVSELARFLNMSQRTINNRVNKHPEKYGYEVQS